jgi:stress-induced-phosphoprotein 1
MNTKTIADQNYKVGNYVDAVKIYTHILEDGLNLNVMANRCASNIKLACYSDALVDAIEITKLKPGCSKSWGRLGASLYGLNKMNESLTAYTKAYDLALQNNLDTAKMYLNMIKHLSSTRVITSKILDINMLNDMFEMVISNQKILDKLSNSDFQNKVLSFQTNPLGALKDHEIMDVLSELMVKFKF